jgi:FkbM family methyltransferase
MNVHVISAIRRVAQRVRHWPPLRFLEPVWTVLRGPYLLLLHKAGSARGIAVTVGGHPLYLHPVFATLRWEHLEHAAYRAFVDELSPDSVVFDIGAHVGTYSLLAAGRVRPPGRVIAYEPHARTREYLRQHLRWNAGGEQVQVREVCCGATAGQADFYCLPGQVEGTNGLVPVPGFERQSAEVTTVDDEAQRLGCAPTLIKIDVEGAEWDVLRGAIGVLTRNKPVLLLSLHPQALVQQGWSAEGVLDWLRELGYNNEIMARDHEIHVLAKAASSKLLPE